MISHPIQENAVESPNQGKVFDEYLDIIHQLRKKCPWDMEQTHESLRAHLVEETFEAIESITKNDMEGLKFELGDLMLHVVLQAIIAEEEGVFTMEDVLLASKEKLIRRHPHVFGETTVNSVQEIRKNWESIKRLEGKLSLIDGVPADLPALIRAQRIQGKASAVGFDWQNKGEVWKKVEEETAELKKAEMNGDTSLIEDEFGDLLFSLVNYSRFLKVDAEFALRKTIDKFVRRFNYVEERLKAEGKTPEESTLEEMDRIWNDTKRKL
jgi:MazG family protein